MPKTHDISPTTRAPACGQYIYRGDQDGDKTDCSACLSLRPVPTAGAYVNRGPGHMPLGLADRMAHDRRLAERGERDES